MKSPTPLAHSILSRLPARNDALKVFGVVLFAVFGWSIRGFLFKIPSFSLYFGLGTNLAILCYMFAFALFESVLVTGVLVVLAAVLPARFLKVGFAYKGFLIVLVTTIAMIAFEGYYKVDYFKDIRNGDDSSIPPFVMGVIVSTVSLFGLLWLFHAKPRLQRYALFVAEQFSVFMYIYVPLGVIGLIVVVLRNLL